MPQALGPLIAGAALGPAVAGTALGALASSVITLGIGIGLSFIPNTGGGK